MHASFSFEELSCVYNIQQNSNICETQTLCIYLLQEASIKISGSQQKHEEGFRLITNARLRLNAAALAVG